MDTVTLTPRSLYAKLGTPQALLILDVRRQPTYEADPHVIVSALRPAGDLVEFVRARAAGRPIAVYCAHGLEIGQGARATLAQAGFDTAYLTGGIEAWREEGLPTMRKRPEWHVPGGSHWITRERPKIDRIACPWLVRRFIDPLATFHYVPASKVFDEAKARDAVPYDIAGAVVTHRGERCSFDALIEDFDLHDPALDHLALIVRGADTDRHDLAPQCAGLLATSLGLSKRLPNDHEMLENAMPVYDGLYAWCRAEHEGEHERHTWTQPA